MALISRSTGSIILRGLSSFWTKLFADTAVYESLYSATEAALGDVYLDLMEAVLSVSLRNTPVFSKRDWQLLLLNNTDLSFDPAVYSFATTGRLSVPVTLTALDLSPARDNVSVEISDATNLTPTERITFPTYGIYNFAIVTGQPNEEGLWLLQVPTGYTISDSVQALTRRLISNKRVDQFTIAAQPDLSGLTLAVRSNLVSQGNWNAATGLPALPPATGNAGEYYIVSVAGTTNVNGNSTWAVGDWLVSDGTVWRRAINSTPTIYFKYGNIISNPVVLPAGAYSTPASLLAAVQAAIVATNATMAVPMNISASLDGGYLVFTADKDTFFWQTNTAAEQQIYVKEFRFKLSAAVPPGRESQYLWKQTTQLQLQTAGYAPAGSEYRFPIGANTIDAKYIYNALYQPDVILERPRHFRIANGYIYFKDNPFSLTTLAFRNFGKGVVQIAFWLGDVSVDKMTLYYNFGYRFTSAQPSSQVYKNLLEGIYYYYTHGPQVERVISALNLIAGIPVAVGNETVLSVDPLGVTVVTDQNTYTFNVNTPANVAVGQFLQSFDSMSSAFSIEDYINTPDWFNNFVIPAYLIPEAPLGYRLSTATTFIPLVGDPGFIVGDSQPGSQQLDTFTITPIGLNNYALTADAFFAIEKDNNGIVHLVYVPVAITTGATSLSAMSAYLTLASMQIHSNPVNCAGATPYQVLTTSVFTLGYLGQSYTISVSPADTAGFASLASLVTLLQTKLNTALGAGVIRVYQYAVTGSLVFIPAAPSQITISNLNISASSELGLFPASSLIGITIKEVQQSYLSFTSNTVGSTSFIAITQMNSVALTSLSMTPFQVGSGDFFGTSGDPSPGWSLMNTYLKYNTFRVKYNPSVITLESGGFSVAQIVSSGRPLYTAPIVLPELQLQDSVISTGLTVSDLDAIPALTGGQAEMVDFRIVRKASVYQDTPIGIFWRKDGVPGDPQRYVYYYSVNSSLVVTGLSTNGGTLTFTSTEPGLRDVNHLVEITDLSSINVGDVNYFNSVGVFNRGKAVGGITVTQQTLNTGTIGGIYPADHKGAINGAHWVQGFDKASFYETATHVFVIDAAMKTGGIDPFASGVTAGDFMTLKNFSDPHNNGKFVVLNYFRNVPFLKQKNLLGQPIIVDLVVYRNNKYATTTQENYLRTNIPSFATLAFSPKGRHLNNQWLVVLPGSGTLSSQVSAVTASTTDDKALFPFTITYNDGDWVPPAGPYYGGLTTDGGTGGTETMYGDLYKITWDVNPAHEDEEAQGIYAPSGYSSFGFIIGDPQVFLQDFSNVINNSLKAALVFKSMWNAATNTPSLPAPAPGNYGWYYFTTFPGNTVQGSITSWNVGDWVVSDGTQWLKFNDVVSERVIAYPTPNYSYDQALIDVQVGGTGSSFGYETYTVDPDAVGSLNHTTGWRIGNDEFGRPLYVTYNSSLKVGTNLKSYGEVAFWRSLKIYFNPLPPGDDRSEYLGPNGTTAVTQTLGLWPTGGQSVYPSDNFLGYFNAATNQVGSHRTLPRSFIYNLDESVLQLLSFVGGWNASTNTPAVPAASAGNIGEFYLVSVQGNTTIDSHTGWVAGEYLVSDGTQWVYCASAATYGFGIFYTQPTGLSPSLPSSGSSTIGDTYIVTTAGNTPISGVTSPAESGHDLFELGDWVIFNGLNWVRNRLTSTYAEAHGIVATRLFEETNWQLVPAANYGASESFGFGLGLQTETVTAYLPSSDPSAGVIGAGAAPGDGSVIPAGYVIGGTSLWTGLIGPFEGSGYVGDALSSMHYVLTLNATAFFGFGPTYLNSLTFFDTQQTYIENSTVFQWNTDNSVSPNGAISRVYNGAGFYTLYFQVPESSIDEGLGGQGVTIDMAAAGLLLSSASAVRLLYFDGVSWGSTDSLASLPSAAVTGAVFTLQVLPSDPGNYAVSLWNGTDTMQAPSAVSANIAPSLYTGHTGGLVVVAVTVDSSLQVSFGSTSAWVHGVLFTRTLLT